jgi:hypothetical protein
MPGRRYRVLARWGPGGGPRNVLIEYADGRQAVIPFPAGCHRLSSVIRPGLTGTATRQPIPPCQEVFGDQPGSKIS